MKKLEAANAKKAQKAQEKQAKAQVTAGMDGLSVKEDAITSTGPDPSTNKPN